MTLVIDVLIDARLSSAKARRPDKFINLALRGISSRLLTWSTQKRNRTAKELVHMAMSVLLSVRKDRRIQF